MRAPNFKLLVPCGYPTPYRIEGATGSTPDVGLLRLDGKCWRSTLPPFLDNLVFNFVKPSSGSTVHVQNFFHLEEFFVVSDSMKEFLEAQAGCEFEARKIQTRHPRGEATGQYWAVKVKTTIDCVEPDRSFANCPSWSSDSSKTFAELALEVKLTNDVAPSYANKGSDAYYAYPSSGIQRASMDFSAVPPGTRLFQPMYWPQYLIVEEAFARQLEMQCSGGTRGYYFWTSGFDDVSRQLLKTQQELR